MITETDWSSRRRKVLLEKLTVPQLFKKFPELFWSPNVPYGIHKSPPPLIPLLSQINPVHDPSHFLNIHFNIIFPSTSRSSVDCFPQVSPPQPCKHLSSPHTCYISRQSHFFYLITRIIIFVEVYITQSSSLSSLRRSPVIPSLLGPNISSARYSRTPQPTFLPRWPSFTSKRWYGNKN